MLVKFQKIAKKFEKKIWRWIFAKVSKSKKNRKKLRALPISNYFNPPKIKNKNILNEGVEVHVAKDFPTDHTGKRLYGKIRAGEFKYEGIKRKITQVCIYPNQDVRYLIEGKKASYQRNQLILA